MTIYVKPKRRSSTVERRIIDCSARGEEASFADLVSKTGVRPSVSASFLAAILSGEDTAAQVHPRGLIISDLRIEGNLQLDNIWSRRDGSELPGFHAIRCTIDGNIDVRASRIAWLLLDHCDVLGGEDKHKDLVSINLFGAVARQVRFERCRFAYGLMFDALECSIELFLCYCVVWRPLEDMAGSGAISMRGAKLNDLGMLRVKLCAPVFASGLVAAGDVVIVQVIVRSEVACGLELMDARLGGLHIVRCRIDGGMRFNSGECQRSALIMDTKIRVTDRDSVGIDLRNGNFADLTLSNLRIDGPVALMMAQFSQSLTLSKATISLLTRLPSVSDEDHAAWLSSVGGLSAVDLTFAAVKGAVVWRDLLIEGCLNAPGFSAGHELVADNVAVSSQGAEPSCRMHLVKVGGIASFHRCEFAAGLSIPSAKFGADLQLTGCGFGTRTGDFDEAAIWLSDTEIAGDLFFGISRPDKNDKRQGNRVGGMIMANGVKVGKSVRMASTDVHLSSFAAVPDSFIAVNLRGAVVIRHVALADRYFERRVTAFHIEKPARIFGCVSLEDAVVGGDVFLHRTVVEARGESARPHDDVGEEFISERGSGVALSLQGVRITGALELGEPRLGGQVDLRRATIGQISDRGGTRWAQAGVKPGEMLMEGLYFDRLQAEPVARTPVTLLHHLRSAIFPSDAAAHARLNWIASQYADGRPNPNNFHPQPYEHLSRHYGGQGNDRARRVVVVARRDLQRRLGRLSMLERGVGWFLKITCNYGYAPGRALISLALVIGCGVALANLAGHAGALQSLTAGRVSPDPTIYAIDLSLPLIELGAGDVHIDAAKLAPPFDRQWLIDLLLGVYQLVSIIVVSVTLLTFSGILREKD